MKISKLNALCASCNYKFEAEIVVEAPIKVTLSSIKEMRCPHCNAGPAKVMIDLGTAAV